jgi:hypothetical protein
MDRGAVGVWSVAVLMASLRGSQQRLGVKIEITYLCSFFSASSLRLAVSDGLPYWALWVDLV